MSVTLKPKILFVGYGHLAKSLASKPFLNNFKIDSINSKNRKYSLNSKKTIKKLNPPHISCYQLTIEKGTLFYKEKPHLPSNDELEVMQTFIEDGFKNNYSNYEISAFAKEKFACVHNFHYWTFGDYIGIGPGAHSKLTFGHVQQVLKFDITSWLITMLFY